MEPSPGFVEATETAAPPIVPAARASSELPHPDQVVQQATEHARAIAEVATRPAQAFTPPPVSSLEGAPSAPGGFTPPPLNSLEGRTWLDSAGEFAHALYEGSGARTAVDLLGAAGRNPEQIQKGADTAKALIHGLINEPKRVWDALGETGKAMMHGDVGGASYHLAGAVPMVGPGAQQVGQDVDKGDYAKGFGHAIGLLGPFIAPEVAARVRSIPVTPRIVNPNPTEAAAMAHLESRGVPVSAAAKTGNAYVRGGQKIVDSTPIGAVVASRAESATTTALQGEAGSLSGRAHPTPVIPEQAGEGVRTALRGRAAASGADADTAYAQFRNIEADPANVRSVQQGTKQQPVLNVQGQPVPGQFQAAPVMEDVALPTDMRAIKAQLKPMVADMDQWMEPAGRNSSAGYQAAKSIVNGADYLPASVAEAGLGGLKQLARDGAGRNAGMAKYVVPKLQAEIDRAVGAANHPGALPALEAGRAATAAQYGTKAILDDLRAEPVQAFNQLTWQKDAGIDRLRRVAREAPGEMPKLGRAWLEDLFGKAQSQGGFSGADGMFAKWRDMGPETKKLLFTNSSLVSDLDKFFLGAKKLAENPNPSGSAVVGLIGAGGTLIVTHPATGIPLTLGAGALSKMMHSPAGVRLLTNGMRIPLKAPGPAAVIAGQILKMAGRDVTPAVLPKAADATGRGTQSAPVAMIGAR